MSQSVPAQAGTTTDAPTPTPFRRSPLESGQWYPKKKFEKHYHAAAWLHLMIITSGAIRVRVRPYDLQKLLRTHKDGYFQLAWNDQPHYRERQIQITGKRSAERFTKIPVTDAPHTTIKLRICYALTPERDTEIVLHDGYGLPEINDWWQKAKGYEIALPLPAEAQAVTEHPREVAA